MEAVAAEARAPLTRERVLRAAVDLADRDGIAGLSMRRLGQSLDVEAMALYRHVRDKDELLDGAVDAVVGEIEPTTLSDDWRGGLRNLAMAARAVMLRHPWAPAVMVAGPEVGPHTLRHLEAVMATLLGAGFSLELAHHALHVLGSRVLGFTQDPFNDAADVRPEPEVAARMAQAMAVNFPSLGALAMAASHDGAMGGCDDDVEFAFGLDLILDGLDLQRQAT
jgi:AcrR family transcriptional regulator